MGQILTIVICNLLRFIYNAHISSLKLLWNNCFFSLYTTELAEIVFLAQHLITKYKYINVLQGKPHKMIIVYCCRSLNVNLFQTYYLLNHWNTLYISRAYLLPNKIFVREISIAEGNTEMRAIQNFYFGYHNWGIFFGIRWNLVMIMVIGYYLQWRNQQSKSHSQIFAMQHNSF